MTRLFEASFVERFRPQTLRGSYQWTYCLARGGFRAAEQTGDLAPGLKFAPRRESIFDYRYAIHDLRTNEWVLRYRELLGDRLLDWAGPDESRYEPPKKSRDEEYFSRASAILGDCGWHASDVPDEYFRPVQPDAVLDVAAADYDVRLLVEYDRTRRVDKNFDKFLRYETLLVVWWRATNLGCPYVVFVCQDAEHRRRFMLAADAELTGHLFAQPSAVRRSATPRETGRSSSSKATSAAASTRPRRCRRCRRATSIAPTRPPSAMPRCLASRADINTVPPGLFPPRRSVLAVRSERNTRPDPPTPETPHPACAARGRGVHRFALDPPSSTCQINQGRAARAGGAERASAGRGAAGRGARKERGTG